MLQVVCWKWAPEKESKHFVKRAGFSAKHVNVLYASLKRFLTLPHKLVCVTDDYAGIRPEVTIMGIDGYFKYFKELGGCYRRLRAFDRVGIFGQKFISIDLDVVICGNLDKIFDFDEDFKIWEDTFRRRTPYCGSLWGMETGAREKVWEEFFAHPELSIKQAREKGFIGTDQAVVSSMLHPREATWGIADGIYNFNTQIRVNGKALPGNAKLVFFNGKYDPSQHNLQARYPWIKELWKDE